MDERLKESISALLDDEANELEIRRIVNKSSDDELRALWGRYNKVSDVLSSGRHAYDHISPLDIDISSRISLAIDDEDELGLVDVDEEVNRSSLESKKPVATYMQWASIAAVLVLSVSIIFNTVSDGVGVEGEVLMASVSVDSSAPLSDDDLSVLDSPSLAPENARKLNEYMLRHAGNSVIGGQSSLMPLVRVASLSMTAY